MPYRLDNRNKQEFKSDIKICSARELEIVIRLGIYLYNKTGVWEDIIPIGCDFRGDFQNKVDSSPDFLLGSRTLEITQSRGICKEFYHEKCPKVNNCIKNGYYIVFVNGIETEAEPETIVINAKKLAEITDISIEEYGIVKQLTKTGIVNKDAYRYKLSWTKDLSFLLPKMIDNLPENYRNLLEKING